VPLVIRLREQGPFFEQFELVKSLITQKRFIIIILDACRYDIFRAIYHRYLHGTLYKVRSPGSDTVEWLMKVFPYMRHIKDVYIFSANPIINSQGIKYRGFRALDYVPKNRIIDVWDVAWDDEFCTVPPWRVNEVVMKYGIRDKMIIWYLQPHFPWLNFRDLFKSLIKESTKMHRKLGNLLIECIKKGTLSKLDVWKGYLFNTVLVLREVCNLIECIRKQSFNGPIVITSDHGELLGEYGCYWHVPGERFPELIYVPWLEVSSSSSVLCNKFII